LQYTDITLVAAYSIDKIYVLQIWQLENRSTGRKTCLSATLSTTNPQQCLHGDCLCQLPYKYCWHTALRDLCLEMSIQATASAKYCTYLQATASAKYCIYLHTRCFHFTIYHLPEYLVQKMFNVLSY